MLAVLQEDILLDARYQVPDSDISIVRLTKDAVEKRLPPEYLRRAVSDNIGNESSSTAGERACVD